MDKNIITITFTKERLIEALKDSLIGYRKDIGSYESQIEYIQEKDYDDIANDLIEILKD